MLRRCFAHDYCSPGAYMVTMAVPQRGSNPFGVVKGDVRQGRMGVTVMPEEARLYAALAPGEGQLRMELTPLGAAVLKALEGIPANYPMVEVRKAQIMPDHLHVILFVKEAIVSSNGKARHLGHVIAGYKKGCNRVFWGLEGAAGKPQCTENAGCEERFARSGKVPSNARTGRPSLWAEGYTDTIILSKKHMATEVAYLDDNIYRLRMKQMHSDLFRNVLHIRINGREFAALGNIHLMRRPRKVQVQYHRWEANDPKVLHEHTERLMKAGDEGAVFVSPFISETEKAIRNAALTMGIPYIRLTREGFRDLYTPSRSEFEACCEGNLLLLAPWEERLRTSTITRRECLMLNDIAATIASDELVLTWVRSENNVACKNNVACQNNDNSQNDNKDENEYTIIPRDDEEV